MRVRFMSWNLKRLRLTDACESARVNRLCSFLHSVPSPPDVLGVQELIIERDTSDAAQKVFDAFALQLGFEPNHCFLGQTGSVDTRTAIFTRFPIVHDRGFRHAESVAQVSLQWPEVGAVGVPGPITFSRPPVHVTLEMAPEKRITVLAAHLKSRRPLLRTSAEKACVAESSSNALALATGMFVSLQVRSLESLALRMLLSRLVDGRPAEPLVALCDLNDGIEAVTTQIVLGTSTPMERSCDGRDVLFDVTMLIEPQARWTYERRGMRLHLDHILVNHVLRGSAEAGIFHDVLNRDHAECLSDHAPVWADLDVA